MLKTQDKKRKQPAKRKEIKVHRDAAGIDLGSREHFVALPSDRDQPVRSFGCFTADLNDMARWLLEHRIATVAMEATGVYWVPVYQVLEDAGLDVQLVNARHYSNVPGRKTDVQDCQWLQYLHECGLVRGSFRPKDEICVIRSYQRQRDNWIEESSRHMLRMQKALEQMNIQLHKVIRDITGTTGLTIIKAIVAGERDPKALLEYRSNRCKHSEEEFIKALTGDWRAEHLFCLRQELHGYEYAQEQAEQCEQAVLKCLRKLPVKSSFDENAAPPKGKRVTPEIHSVLFRAAGTDLLAAEGFGPTIVMRLLAEVGTDMSAWPTEGHFTSWARLCPRNNITGGKRRRAPGDPKIHRVKQIFKTAAYTVTHAKSALGAYYRSVSRRRDAATANAATAHKLARIFYRIMKFGDAYVRQDAERYDSEYQENIKKGAVKRLKELGFDVALTAILQPTAVGVS
jgi:transposase